MHVFPNFTVSAADAGIANVAKATIAAKIVRVSISDSVKTIFLRPVNTGRARPATN